MRKFVILLLISLFSEQLSAICAAASLTVYPRTGTLKQNSLIILEGYGESQKITTGLNKKYPIYLQCGSKKIYLIAKEVHKGLFRVTQALLIPIKPLEVGLEYTLHIDSLDKYEHLDYWDYKSETTKQVKWKIVAETDVTKPIVTANPKVIKKSYQEFGCGPSASVLFNCHAKDESGILVKGVMTNLKSGKITTYYIEPYENLIMIGHDMCSGPFNFEDGGYYEIQFTFFDSCGNKSEWKGKPIRFTKPTKTN